MKEKDVCSAASIVLCFLREYNFTKAEKAFLAEGKKRGWLEENLGDSTINLVTLCASERRRKRREQKEASQVAGSQSQDGGQESPEQSGPRKKRKAGSNKVNSGEAVEHPSGPVATIADVTDSDVKPDHSRSSSGQKAEQKRFQRVDNQQWTSTLPAELRDNSFWRKKNDSFAVKAAEQLGKVRGKDFRHEKTKKKRASWKGCGEIPMTVNSIQFDSDSE